MRFGQFPDGDESHGVLRIVVNKFFNQLVPDFAHRHEKSQTQIFRGHFTEEIRIERGVLRLERADEDLFSIAQSNVAFEQGGHRLPRRCFLMRHQHRNRHQFQQAKRSAPEHKFAQA